MRTLTALLLLLLCSLYLVFSAPASLDHKTHCCLNTTTSMIPKNKIVTYWWTSSNCPIHAIVFQTIAKKMFCVRPGATWVDRHMKSVDSNRKKASKP